MGKLSAIPPEYDDESFGSFVFRTLRVYTGHQQGRFLRAALGYGNKEANKILAVDLRLPPQEMLRRFALAVHTSLGEGTPEELEASYRQRTLWSVAERLELSPQNCAHNPFLLGPETVCPVCLSLSTQLPPYRRIAWQPGFTTVCLHHAQQEQREQQEQQEQHMKHTQPVLLTGTCARGGSATASVLRGRLPHTLRYHSRSPQCAGCDLSEVEPVSLAPDDLGVVAQEVLQVKLAAWAGAVSPEASHLLESRTGSLAPPEFWKLLKTYLTLTAFLVEVEPARLYDPLSLTPRVHIPASPGGFPVTHSVYAKHCLLTTAVMWLLGQFETLSFDEALRAIALHHHERTGRLELPELLVLELERRPQLLVEARTSLEGLYRTCVSLDVILAQRGQPEVPVERLAAQAHLAGIHLVSPDVGAGGTQTVHAVPGDVSALLDLEFYCAVRGCGELAVRGHNDFLYCVAHEHRCSLLTCKYNALQGGFCIKHSGLTGPLLLAETVSASPTASGPAVMPAIMRAMPLPGRRHRCLEPDCPMWRNWRYRKYCSKHGREKGLEPLRKFCRKPGCPLQIQSGRANYCVKHAEEHGIPGPAQCSAACCRRAVKVNGLCRVCADGGIPSELRRCVTSGCPELGTRKRHWLCAAHFQESKQKAIGQPCAFAGCDLNRNVGYRQFCTKHGREHGLLLRRVMCRDGECDLRAILASVGYCAKHARKHGIKIPKYHCSEVDCLRSPLKYGGQCRKHDKDEIHACAA